MRNALNKPYICLINVWYICEIFLGNAWYILEIHLRYICEIFLGNAWYILEIHLRYIVRYAWDILKIPNIYQIYTWDIPLILWYTQDIPEISLIYAQNLLKVCQKYICIIPDIYPKYTWDKPMIYLRYTRYTWYISKIYQSYTWDIVTH